MWSRHLFFAFSIFTSVMRAQDTAYVRQCLKFLCSPVCYGRGYVNKGLQRAEAFIVSEIRKTKAQALFEAGFTQAFHHTVNTFPKTCEVKWNGKTLRPGIDYILDPVSSGGKGKCTLTRKDSITLTGYTNAVQVTVKAPKKLTYSVGHTVSGGNVMLDINRSLLSPEPVTLEWKITQTLNADFVSKNIGAIIKGSEQPDSMLVFTAHYDHLGGMGNKTFFPGANDNGAGIAGLLDLMRHYTSSPPRYSVVFLFFAGEEAGLLGSKFFVEHSPIDLKKIKFLINLDLIGTGDDGITVVNATEFKAAFERLKKINEAEQLVKYIKPRGKAANSDHYWFTEKGVLSFFIYTMGGISAYHDVMDVEKTLPLTDYVDVIKLLLLFTSQL